MNNKKTVPVILDGGINGLGVIRSFGEAGINSIVIDKNINLAFHSKYAEGLIAPDPVENEKEFIQYLIEMGKSFKQKGLLIPTSDRYLICISKNQDLLNDYFIFTFSSWDIISKLIIKKNLYELAEENKIPYPKTFNFNTAGDLLNTSEDYLYPLILKPSITVGFEQLMGDKVLTIYNKKELIASAEKLIKSNLSASNFILQEFIPGGIENLYTITSYANKESKMLGYSIGHKLRQNPPVAGSIISGKVIHIPEIYELGKQFISASKFFGLSNIEFKKDDRDGSYKLMEINPRTGVWNYSAKASGINLPLLAYKDLVEGTAEMQTVTGKEIVWINSVLDAYKSLYGFRKEGYSAYHLTPGEWWKSLHGKKVDAIYNGKDISPFIYYLKESFRHIVKI